ncbi:hypothetical protein [Candidatus Methanosphaera massiliense]|jgi:hypothetical protein|uniref:hypothetical protein n=1 Tax=Methanosphaera TaxID=2316 RepID=UPI000DC5C8FE|nr:hypothetical protein [Candidatus Methanosphaera massiliense]MDD6286008.1 hypothetical protein [Methanobacteriaceae archaeon]MDE4077826.1 hypothetical protein [Candidatus Methanosphaera massiliense]RAP43891.1 MAG: hypothetical protein BZ134_05315 [Methanosphaera sp. SHI1033]
MIVECKLCGNKFESSEAEEIECNCGCGGENVLCPNCGYEVRLPRTGMPKKVKKEEDMGFFGKVMSALRMGN